MNLFVVAAVHGTVTVLFGRVFVAQIPAEAIWPYAIAVAGGYAVFAAALAAHWHRWPLQAGHSPS